MKDPKPPIETQTLVLPLSRRRFLKATGGSLALLGLTGLTGCVDEELGPEGDGFTVWIAQQVTGSVRHSVTQQPIEGATVNLFAGFDKSNLFPISNQTKTTSSEGFFSFVRAQETGVPGDFWWFVVGDTNDRTVHLRLDVRHGGFTPVFFTPPTERRTPSKEAPTRNLGMYALHYNILMHQISP
jgi:hypothetical protein